MHLKNHEQKNHSFQNIKIINLLILFRKICESNSLESVTVIPTSQTQIPDEHFCELDLHKLKFDNACKDSVTVIPTPQKQLPDYNLLQLDLHWKKVQEATKALLHRIKELQENKDLFNENDKLVVIVGRGNNSPGNIPKIKPAIIKLLKKEDIEFRFASNGKNKGAIEIVLKELFILD